MTSVKKPKEEIQHLMLGMLGERIVAHVLRKAGHEVEESLNVFDAEKDMLVDGQPVEVKTQVPFIMEDAFAVSDNQMTKIRRCTEVYFISVPPAKTVDPNAGCVYRLDMSASPKAHRRRLESGREVVCFPRSQSAMEIIYRIEDDNLLEQMRRLSTSYL